VIELHLLERFTFYPQGWKNLISKEWKGNEDKKYTAKIVMSGKIAAVNW